MTSDFGTGLPLYELSVAGIALGWIVVAALTLVVRRCAARRLVLEVILWAYLMPVLGLSFAYHGSILSGSLNICYGCPGPTSPLHEVAAHALSVLILVLWPLAGVFPTYTTSKNVVGAYLGLAVLLGMALTISAWGLCAARTLCQNRRD